MKNPNNNSDHKPIECIDEPNAVTIRISGAAFEQLKKIAAALNKWDDADNTPADIVSQYLCDSDEWTALGAGQSPAASQTLAGIICGYYRKAPDVGELESAFKAAGVLNIR